MPKSATLPIVPIDDETKKKLFKSCSSLGISYSALITLFVKKWLSGELSINISHQDDTDYLLSTKANKQHLNKSLSEEKEGKLNEVSMDYLKSML